jgi:hypothetical protein
LKAARESGRFGESKKKVVAEYPSKSNPRANSAAPRRFVEPFVKNCGNSRF